MPLFSRHPLHTASSAGESDSLYFRPDEVPALRKRLETVPHLAPRWRLLQKNADDLLTTSLARGPLDIQRTRAALGNIGITAFAFALTQKRDYADRALREANALLDEPTWIKPSPGNRGANLATGEASTACALAYDWCRAALTENEKSAFRARLFARGIQPYLDAVGPLNDWWRENDVTNWSGVVNGGCGLASLVLAGEIPEARAPAEFAWKRIQAFLKTANRADGGGDEGVMYYTYGMLFANYFAVAAARRFGDDRGVFRDATAKMAGYYLVGMQGSDGKYANFNDMGDETFAGLPPKNPEGGPNATLCALWEAHAPGGDKLLAWAADNGGDNYYWRGASPFSLLFRGLRPAPLERPRFPASALFRESGQAVWQTPALWFAFNGGWTSDKSHYNLDLGSFVLVAHGERLVWDPGYGKVKTGDHSALLVDGMEQVKAARGTYEAWAEGPGWRWLACDVSQAYKSSPLTRWVRHAVLLESDKNAPILLLVDDLAASRPSVFETRLQINGNLTISDSSAVVRASKAALSVAWAASGSDAKPEIASGKGASDYVRASLRAATKARLVTALCPVAAASPNALTAAITLTTAPAANDGFTVTVEREKQKSVLVFAVADGKLRLVALNGRPTPNLPGAERRSLRRVS